MKRRLQWLLAGAWVLAMAVLAAVPACAQTSEVKEKPPMYSYIANWAIPRAQWGEMDKQGAANQKMLEKALADGTIIGYGADTNLIHQADGWTHDSWWSSMSMAGLLNVLEQSYKSGGATAPVLLTATRHNDIIYVSRYYNWHPGSWTGLYTRVASYQLKADAAPDALDTVSKNLFVPMLEKLLADGAIHEYEIDTQAIHTDAPGMFEVIIIAADGAGLDKFNAAVRDLQKSSPMAGPALNSMVDFTAHRDELARTSAAYK